MFCFGKTTQSYFYNSINNSYFKKYIQPLIKNDKLIFSIYIRIYNNNNFGICSFYIFFFFSK